MTFLQSLKTTASWLDLSKPSTQPCSFQLPLIANNQGMVSQRYLNTKTVPSARNGTRIILQLECFQTPFSRSIWAARSCMPLTCTGPVILQQRCFGKKCGLIGGGERERERPSYPQLVSSLFGLWCTHSFFSFLNKWHEPAIGSHYDLDLTCTNNIPGLIWWWWC